MHRLLALLIGTVVVFCAAGAADAAREKAKKRLLVVTHTEGFRHGVIPKSEQVLQDLSGRSGFFTVDFCRTKEDVKKMLTLAGLRDYDGVFFANTTGNLGIPNLPAFLAWIKTGRAFLGAHAATDTYRSAAPGGSMDYIEMIGGEFKTHGKQCEIVANVDDPSHPSVKHLAPAYTVFDEIYEHIHNDRTKVHALLSIDKHPDDGHPEANQPADMLIAWCKDYGKGKVFYTALGHRDEVWEGEPFQKHIIGALKWAFGLEKGRSEPQQAKAAADR